MYLDIIPRINKIALPKKKIDSIVDVNPGIDTIVT